MRNMILRIPTEQKLEARFLKFIPKNWVGLRSLKLELYGCSKGKKTRHNHPQFYPGRFAHQWMSLLFPTKSVIFFCNFSQFFCPPCFIVCFVGFVTSYVQLLVCACAVEEIKKQSCCVSARFVLYSPFRTRNSSVITLPTMLITLRTEWRCIHQRSVYASWKK